MQLKENLKEGRIISIDAFRGITILVMIFVNELASKSGIPQWLKHMPASADAMTFVDVVFPAFLFIVGMSIPFSFQARLKKGDSVLKIWLHTLKRSGALIIMGVFMVNAEYGYDESAMILSPAAWGLFAYLLPVSIWNKYSKETPLYLKRILQLVGIAGLVVLYFLYVQKNGSIGMTPKWWGILGLIGWAYLLSVIVYWFGNGKLVVMIVFFFVCVAGNIINHIDGLAINEIGWFSFLCGHMIHATMVCAGIIVSLLFFEKRKSFRINWPVIASTFLLFILAYILRPYFEVSKIRGTPSWTLYSAGICCLMFYLLYIVIEEKGLRKWSGFIMPAASDPLLIYILPGIIIYFGLAIGLKLVPGWFESGIPAIIWSGVFSLLMLWVVHLLNKIGIRLHL